jgi:hypothetical protein
MAAGQYPGHKLLTEVLNDPTSVLGSSWVMAKQSCYKAEKMGSHEARLGCLSALFDCGKYLHGWLRGLFQYPKQSAPDANANSHADSYSHSDAHSTAASDH